MRPIRGLTKGEVEKFYDWFGLKQDKQKYYEDVALTDLLEHASFETARSVAEVGCGTGRFAEELLASHLPHDATYWGCDINNTMIKLSQKRQYRITCY
jgi:ubiquinone/menaquinone biosynthesis C-methylase UbiE